MFKSVISIVVLAVLGIGSALSQNLQLHFDPRHAFHSKDFDRNIAIATFEMFKPDQWGSTFMFVDVDFSQSRGNIGLMYTEIARAQKIGNLPIRAHIEFNGGRAWFGEIPNAYLLGVAYPFSVGKFFINTYATYKYHAFEKVSNDIQWTAVWSANFFNDKLTVNGFFDFWTENKNRDKKDWKSGKKIVILSEPQFWYNVDGHLSCGTEIEISHNFFKNSKKEDTSFINPTLGVKWTF